jgi:hypothetical protein
VITFDIDEPQERIHESLVNLTEHPELSGIPLIALSVDYGQGLAQAIGHSFHRNRDIEEMLVSRCVKPEGCDESVLVLLCSDSRVHPPSTPVGVPYAIQTLGAYVSKYSGADDETTQLNDFFSDWLSTDANEKRILIVEHGGFTREEPPCGAGQASLNPQQVKGEFLRPVIELLNREALRFEDGISKTVEDRVLAIGQATEYNLRNYPAIAGYCYRQTPRDWIRAGCHHHDFKAPSKVTYIPSYNCRSRMTLAFPKIDLLLRLLLNRKSDS